MYIWENVKKIAFLAVAKSFFSSQNKRNAYNQGRIRGGGQRGHVPPPGLLGAIAPPSRILKEEKKKGRKKWKEKGKR